MTPQTWSNTSESVAIHFGKTNLKSINGFKYISFTLLEINVDHKMKSFKL